MGTRTHTLSVRNLSVSVEKKLILRDVTLEVLPGQTHALMGPNGSGKSTLAYALSGHPNYSIGKGSYVRLGSSNLLKLSPDERSKAGLFLAMQAPIAIPGVSISNLLRTAYQEHHKQVKKSREARIQNPLLARRWNTTKTLTHFIDSVNKHADVLGINRDFLTRAVHEGFSGGEKKKIEMLQALTLQPKIAVFDEIDTGLDVDALKVVARAIHILKKNGTGIIVVTHYQRILRYITPDFVHVLVNGSIVRTGGASLAKKIEDEGYGAYETKSQH
jgi:Fe-S cluster assembly ATP-binding protein